MKSNKSLVVSAAVVVVVAAAFVVRASGGGEPVEVVESTEGVPTFIELGSDRCKSCRDMIPVLEELRTTFECNLNVRFIDVWDNPEEGERYRVQAIPTQVLLAPDGQEITRHTGFWSAEAIVAAFASGGHKLQSASGTCGP